MLVYQKAENFQKWSQFEHCWKWLQMSPSSHIKSYFGPFQPKSWQKVKNHQSEAESNIAQNGLKCPLVNQSYQVLFGSISGKKLSKSRKSPTVKPDRKG